MSLLTKKQIIISQIVVAIAAFLLGLMFLLSALGVIPFGFLDAVLIFIPIVGGTALFMLGFVQDNTLLIWISAIFLSAFIAHFIHIFGRCDLTITNLYPIYILSPAIASLLVGVYDSFKLKQHLKIIFPFLALAISFSLNSFWGIHFGIVIACIFLFIALCFVLFIIKTHKAKPNDK